MTEATQRNDGLVAERHLGELRQTLLFVVDD